MDRFPSSLLEVIAYTTASAVVSEAVAWLLIFRKPDYQRLMTSLQSSQKRLDREKKKVWTCRCFHCEWGMAAHNYKSVELLIYVLACAHRKHRWLRSKRSRKARTSG